MLHRSVQISVLFSSFSSGAGRHWFAGYRVSDEVLEIFDPLACELSFLKTYMKIPLVYEFNTTPVQCPGSEICGGFVLYFVIFRYYNLDQGLSDFLNSFFKKDCVQNETVVIEFLDSLT